MAKCQPVHRLTLLIDVTILQQINGNPQPSRDDTRRTAKNFTDGNQRGSARRVLDSRETSRNRITIYPVRRCGERAAKPYAVLRCGARRFFAPIE